MSAKFKVTVTAPRYCKHTDAILGLWVNSYDFDARATAEAFALAINELGDDETAVVTDVNADTAAKAVIDAKHAASLDSVPF